MIIAVKSETDSRVLVYPLLRAVKSYGSILLISSNRALERLIIDEDEGGFRGIRVIIDNSDAADDITAAYGIKPGDYDFVILDNLGAIEYDKYFVVLGSKQSDLFIEDVKYTLMSDEADKVTVFQFGKSVDQARIKELTEVHKSNGSEYDPAEKFRQNDEKRKREKVNSKIASIPFPQYQQIEDVEALHVFYEVQPPLVDRFYEALKDVLSVERIQFQKELRKKDANSSGIRH